MFTMPTCYSPWLRTPASFQNAGLKSEDITNSLKRVHADGSVLILMYTC